VDSTNMITRFAFGKGGIDLSIADKYDCAVIESRSVKPIADAAKRAGAHI